MELIGNYEYLEQVMPPKTISKKLMDELKELDIDLIDHRPVVICPYCFEVHEDEQLAIPVDDTSYRYSCHACGLLVNLQ